MDVKCWVVELVFSDELERKLLAVAVDDTSQAVEEVAEAFHKKYWGRRPDYVSNDAVLRGLACLTHHVYKHHHQSAWRLVDESLRESTNGCPPLKDYSNTETFVTFSGRLDRKGLGLPQGEKSLLKMLLTFYGVEMFFVPTLALAWGFSRISAGEDKRWRDVSVVNKGNRKGKLYSIEDVVNGLGKSLGDLKSIQQLQLAVEGIQGLLRRISEGEDDDEHIAKLADVRNIVAHHDFILDKNGVATWGFNYLHRKHIPAPQQLSPLEIDRHWRELNGAYTLLSSWVSTVHVVHKTRSRANYNGRRS